MRRHSVQRTIVTPLDFVTYTEKCNLFVNYIHRFTNEKEREIKYFEFLLTSKRVDVNPDNTRTKSALAFLIYSLSTIMREDIYIYIYIYKLPSRACEKC